MARHKKSELDAILEQLKQSYATDADLDLEDSLLETEKSEEDAELASALEKIFANNASDTVEKSAEESSAEENSAEDTVVDQAFEETVESVEQIEEETTEVAQDVQPAEESIPHEELSEEEEIVEEAVPIEETPIEDSKMEEVD